MSCKRTRGERCLLKTPVNHCVLQHHNPMVDDSRVIPDPLDPNRGGRTVRHRGRRHSMFLYDISHVGPICSMFFLPGSDLEQHFDGAAEVIDAVCVDLCSTGFQPRLCLSLAVVRAGLPSIRDERHEVPSGCGRGDTSPSHATTPTMTGTRRTCRRWRGRESPP